MDQSGNLLIKLEDLSQFLARENLSDNLDALAALTARLVGAQTCSIMLVKDGAEHDLRMRVCASFGPLPPAAWSASVGAGDGIAGQVMASGRSMLVEDIQDSPVAHLARHADEAGRSLMLAPISIDNRIVGLINVSASEEQAPFNLADLRLLDVVALFVGKSIQVQQLQQILDSRFTQLALLQEVTGRVGTPLAASAYRNPDQVARILAKSLFKEMSRAGFDSAQIIAAASEIIAQLNDKLGRLSAHAARHEQADKPQESA